MSINHLVLSWLHLYLKVQYSCNPQPPIHAGSPPLLSKKDTDLTSIFIKHFG